MESYRDELYHHGVKGMKWGVRRYQNSDGSLTPDGEKRYYRKDGSPTRAGKRYEKTTDQGKLRKRTREFERGYGKKAVDLYNKAADKQDADLARINAKYKDKDTRDFSKTA